MTFSSIISEIEVRLKLQIKLVFKCTGVVHYQHSTKKCAYVSAKLTAAMMKRGAYETELWAMIKCLQTWKHYLHGTSVEIRTDHAPLKYFHTQFHGLSTDANMKYAQHSNSTVKHQYLEII